MNKSCLLVGYFGFGNLGDDLIAEITADILNQNHHTISILRYQPMKIEKKIKMHGYPSRDLISIIKAIQSSDTIIFPGGSIFQDRTSLKSVFYYTLICVFSKLFRKKLILLGQGIGPLHSLTSKVLTRLSYTLANMISVRDHSSYMIIKNWKLQSKTKQVPDIVFSTQSASLLQKQIDIPQVTSDLIFILRPIPQLNHQQNIQYFSSIIKHLQTYKLSIKFVSFHKSYDSDLYESVQKHLSLKIPIEYPASLDDIRALYKNASHIISTRLHGGILSLTHGIHPLLIHYDDKITALADEYHLSHISTNHATLSADDVHILNKYLQSNAFISPTNTKKIQLSHNLIKKAIQENLYLLDKQVP